VDPIRTAEVARLIRRTGSSSEDPSRVDANGDVLVDAVNATLAASPAWYAAHTAELRRQSGNRLAYLDQRYDDLGRLLAGPIFRTQHAEERMGEQARANLETELESVDSELPAPWRGWPIAALTATATFGAIAAAVVAAAATGAPWRVPVDEPESGLFPIFLMLGAALASVVLFRCARSGSQRARVIAGSLLALSMTSLLVTWAQVPATNPVNGVGLRVPLLIAAEVLIVAAAAAAVGGSVLRGKISRYLPSRNRGQQISWFAVPVAIALLLLVVVQPLSRSYLLSANEWLRPATQPAGEAPRSVLNGELAWANDKTSGGLEEAVGTKHGIALAGRSGLVEMLDPATGEIRWRYTRSDTDTRSAELYAVDGGNLVLVDFPGFGKVVLDAATGRRTSAWARGDRDHNVQKADPLLTVESVSAGSDKLRGVDPNGRVRWTYEPGRCTEIDSAGAEESAVAFLSHECGAERNELVGLDLSTGRQLWGRTTTERYHRATTVGDVVVAAVEPGGDSEPASALVAIDPRTGTERWRWQVPRAWACRTLLTPAGRLLVVVDCPGPDSRTNRTSVVTAIDTATGRTSWQHTVPVDARTRVAVTEDARVVTLSRTTRGCDATVVQESGYRRVRLPEGIACSRDAWVFGDQVLTSRRDGTIIALR